MTSFSLKGGLALALMAACLAGCAQTNAKSAAGNFEWTANADRRIILVQPDVVLSELTAGGLQEPRADWTDAARGYIGGDFANTLQKQSITLVPLNQFDNPHDVQLVKLHNAVGAEILIHAFGGAKLPTKGTALDWTLGPGAEDMRARYNADYAMFVFVRDSYSSAGRIAVQLLGAMAGIGVQGGMQIAFVSVVDLKTGNVVWFNTLVSTTGDLRNAKDADYFVKSLLKGNPL